MIKKINLKSLKDVASQYNIMPNSQVYEDSSDDGGGIQDDDSEVADSSKYGGSQDDDSGSKEGDSSDGLDDFLGSGGKRSKPPSEAGTIELLAEDPLFLVLSQYLMCKKTGDNIITVLGKINTTLERLCTSMEKLASKA